MRRNLFGFLLLLLAICGTARADNYDFSAVSPSGHTLYYKVLSATKVAVVYPNYGSDGYYTGYSKPIGALTIPASVTHSGSTYSVTSIDYNAFYRCDDLRSVSFPATITTIGDSAFFRCDTLAAIRLPNGVTTIGTAAFYGCRRASSITVGNAVETIGALAFANCTSFVSLTLPRTLKTVGYQAFSGCASFDTLRFNADSCVLITRSAGNSSYYVFENCPHLKHVYFGDHVKYISSNAFIRSNIDSVAFPNSLKVIGNYAFSSSHLSKITFGTGLDSIGNGAFLSTRLTKLTLPNNLTYIGSYAFGSCASLTEVTLPPALKQLENAFGDCANLTTVHFNADSCYVKNNSYYVFDGCHHLSRVTFGNNVKCIPPRLFENCSRLTSVQLPASLRNIEEYAFKNCTGLLEITFPDALTRIAPYAFQGCTGLRSVTIPANVQKAYNAFYDCSNLDTVYFNAVNCLEARFPATLDTIILANNLRRIPNYLFQGQQVRDVVLPNTVTNIGMYAFEDCPRLHSITLSNALQTIDVAAFMDCIALQNIDIPASVTAIRNNAFSGDSNLTQVRMVDGLDTIGNSAFRYCPRLDSVVIPRTVRFLGDYSFAYCRGLKTVTFNAVDCQPSGYVTHPYFFERDTLTSFFIGDSVRIIPSYLLYGQRQLTTLTLPEHLQTIGSYALTNCEHFATLRFPPSLDTIGYAAFFGTTVDTLYYDAEQMSSITSTMNNNLQIKQLVLGANVRKLPSNFYVFCGSQMGSIVSYATTAPITNGNAIFGSAINYDIPVYIPCTAKESHMQDDGWKLFTNYQQTTGNYFISLLSSDTTAGKAAYVASSCAAGTATIEATPKPHYRFVQWSDGVTTNPRTLTLSQDTLLKALFEEDRVTVTATAADAQTGTVFGTGSYFRGDTVCLAAFPAAGYFFTQYSNGVRQNPYYFVADTDYDLVATFEAPDTLRVHDTLTLTQYDTALVTLHDTLTLTQYDTTFVTLHDTLTLTQYDTAFVTLHDTLTLTQYDTAFVTLHDTLTLTQYDTAFVTLHDTLTLMQYDTAFVTLYDTLTLMQYDTLWMADSLTWYTLQVLSNDASRGVVCGNGRFPAGVTAEIGAIPFEGNRFVQWSDGETANPRTVSVEEDATYTAQFTTVGIDKADARPWTLRTEKGGLVVEGVAGRQVTIYDNSGRRMYSDTQAADVVRFAVPAAGIYVVRVDDGTAKKATVIR